MRNLMALLAILVPLVVTPAAANHVHIDTEILNGWCKLDEGGTSGGEARCIGYINSVADTLARGAPVHGRRACIPENMPMVYLHILTIMELENRPNRDGHMNARDWVARVLAEAFPC
jgi:hypothetical protein